MRATLIEIDQGAPESRWYAKHHGLRVWAVSVHAYHPGDTAWRLLPGQQVPDIAPDVGLHVDADHAWSVREGEVHLRLHEVVAEATQPGLALGVAP